MKLWEVVEAAEHCEDSEYKLMDGILMVEVSELKSMIEDFMEFAVEEESIDFANKLLRELE